MILITGIPRSGTTFLGEIFMKFGQTFIPKCYHSPMKHTWSSNECPAIGTFIDCNPDAIIIEQLLYAMEYYWNENDYCEFVYKNPNLVFLKRKILKYFSFIIFCLRDYESWLISAKNYKDYNTLMDTLEHHRWIKNQKEIMESENKDKLLYDTWMKNVHECIDFCRLNNKPYLIYQFGGEDSLKEICKKFSCMDKFDEIKALWDRKSSHSSSYLDNLNNNRTCPEQTSTV